MHAWAGCSNKTNLEGCKNRVITGVTPKYAHISWWQKAQKQRHRTMAEALVV